MSSLSSVATLLIGSSLTYYFGVRAKRDEAVHKYKEEQCAKLLIKLQGFVGSTANAYTKKEFFEEQYKSWLYCSDEVINAINTMVALIIEGKGEPISRRGQKSRWKYRNRYAKRPKRKNKLRSSCF